MRRSILAWILSIALVSQSWAVPFSDRSPKAPLSPGFEENALAVVALFYFHPKIGPMAAFILSSILLAALPYRAPASPQPPGNIPLRDILEQPLFRKGPLLQPRWTETNKDPSVVYNPF